MKHNIIQVTGSQTLVFVGKTYRCATGKNGFVPDAEHKEGSGKTPIGSYALRSCWYRPDRLSPPLTHLPLHVITPQNGWCDAPAHPCYNQPVPLPFADSHELLWREDEVYDIIVPLGFNDAPVIAGKGSAIFLHIAKKDYSPTEGCIAIAREDMLEVLEKAYALYQRGETIIIEIPKF